jgi:hypothetical protein
MDEKVKQSRQPGCAIAILLLLFAATAARVTRADEGGGPDRTLYLALEEGAGKVRMHAVFGAEQKSYTVSETPEKLRRDFTKLYRKLDKAQATRSVVRERLGRYEQPFYGPVAALLDAAEQVQFIIDEHTIRYAFDLVDFKGRPLFLQKPVSYSTARRRPREHAFSPDWSGLAVSDPSADPDRGVAFLREILPGTTYYDMKDLDLERFRAIPPKDITLLSLHGAVEKRGANMDLNKERLFAGDLARLGSRIVYLDSCQMGASYPLLAALREQGNACLVAPLVSNEAGDSSTKTIRFFFSHLSRGDAPTVAMYRAKIQLHELYSTKKYHRMLEKVFPFRVYLQE